MSRASRLPSGLLRMTSLRSWMPLLALLAAAGPVHATPPNAPAVVGQVAHGEKNIAEASLADPTGRYRHFVLGADYEAASLVVRLTDGRTLKLVLPEDEVFEDRIPRLADLDGDGSDEIVLVRTSARQGTSLVVIAQRGGQLAIIAQSPSTGGPHRWLNPAGIADFNGDGRLDVAYVQQPHAVGLLRVFTLSGGALKEIAAFPGVSNHAAGSNQQGMSVIADFDGDRIADLALPSFDRRSLMFISFSGGPHVLKRVPLAEAATTNFKLAQDAGGPAVVVGLPGGRHVTVPYPR